MSTLADLVQEWIRLDKNPETRKEIQTLWAAGQVEELEKRMSPRIEFGTAGLRGKMEAGWSRMNDLIVLQASQGLCAYVMANVPDARTRGLVVGHDHRHNSDRWAKLTAAAFIEAGMRVHMFHDLVPTPLVPFSVKRLRAACGVMITASHNPKQDNGYKVYWENAVQIIAPHDQGISESIKANLEPKVWSTTDLPSELCADVGNAMREAYFESLQKLCLTRELNTSLGMRFVNTSMHGVSDPFIRRGFELFGFPPYFPVREQQRPDPEFTTLRFPNPEEKGALDLALATADKEGVKYVLAQDPDSDRFSAAEKSPTGEWINFTGDQLGILFASQVLDRYRGSEKSIDKLAMVASTVSSKMIEAMAKREGFKFVECLTGFKYIGNTALDLVKEGYEVPFGYEEAIGFMFGSEIRDKDGVAATLAFAELVISLQTKGQTAYGYLQELYKTYGYFKTSNSYFVCNDPITIDRIFHRLRNYSMKDRTYPTEIGGLEIIRVVDLTIGYDSTNPPNYTPFLPISSGQMIQFRAKSKNDETSIAMTIRTSGTEPKIKYYVEGSGREEGEVSGLLERVVEELGEVWMEDEKNGLVHGNK